MSEIVPSETTVDRLIGGRFVLMNCEENTFHTLNEVATHLWGVIKEGGKTEEDLVFHATLAFEAEEADVRRDVQEFLRRLREIRIIT